jgi:Flp pilus assembly protein CpaB
MKSRGLVVVIALVLAVAAATFMFLFANGVKHNAVGAGAAADVVVSSKDIPVNTNLSALVDSGTFKTIRVPTDAVVEGAVVDVNQLRNQTTTEVIFKNEQIPASRLSSGTAAKGGPLGLPEGHVAIAFKVDAPEGVNGAVTRGAYITVYASFGNLRFVPGANPTAQIKGLLKQSAGSNPTTLPPMTITLIPAAKVLDVVNPAPDATGKTLGGSVTLTLDLTPQDAENLVYAQQAASMWIGLLPPGDTTGHPMAGSVFPLNRVVGKSAA